jgi:hypothetical protein
MAVERTGGSQACGCGGHHGVQITSTGPVNVYTCGDGTHVPPCGPPGCDCSATPISPGQCVPLAVGAKPKQGQRSKLDSLLAGSPVPSALAAGFLQTARRHSAGRPAANAFEQQVHQVLSGMPTALQATLRCALRSVDALTAVEREQLVDGSLLGDLDTPVDPTRLATAVAREIEQRVAGSVFGDPQAVEQERPGRNRFFRPQGESFAIQLPVFTVNELRTNEFMPALSPGDFRPEELQQHCEVVLVNGVPQTNCEVQTSDCPGNFLSDGTSVTCLRVPRVAGGEAVVLQGMNYVSVDARVRLTSRTSPAVTREVAAHVVGDVETPLTELVNGVQVPIRDARVHDRMTFVVPGDLLPGVYGIQVVLPNVTGFPELGNPIVSNAQFLELAPPQTARFTISSETLTAVEETSPASFGSDEVRVRVRAYPVTIDLSQLLLGDELAFDSPELGDVDSGDIRDLTALLFAHATPVDAMFMSIMGFEIDSEKAYQDQVTTFTDAFLDYLKIALATIGTAAGAGALAVGLKDLLALGLAHPLVLAIAAAVVLAVVIFLAWWAPADEIISDSIGLTVADLAELTSVDVPMRAPSEHPTSSGITVKVTPLEKTPTQYRERREYVSSKEGSRYQIVLRYNRVA